MKSPKILRIAVTGTLLGALAFPLSGCDLLSDVSNVAATVTETATAVTDAATEVVSEATSLFDSVQELADIASNVASVVVYDAATGEEVNTVTDTSTIVQAFSGFSNPQSVSLAANEESEEEYRIEMWQSETQLLGQDADSVETVSYGTITTYKDSNVAQVSVSWSSLEISAYVVLTSDGADALRSLASAS